jgi:hypothetical protein
MKEQPAMNHARCRSIAVASVFAIGLASAASAWADSTAVMTTRPTSTASVTAQVTLSTSLGGGTDTETDSAAMVGATTVLLSPTDPPWTSVTFDPFVLDIGTLTYHFQFNLFLILDITVNSFTITAEGPLTVAVGPGGVVAVTGGMFRATGSMHVTGLGGLVDSTFPLDSLTSNDFSGRLTANGGNVVFDQKMLTAIAGSVPAEQLPEGVNSVSYVITVDLTNTIFEGAYVPVVTCDAGAYETLHACMSGPGAAYAGDCGCVDFDSDGDVDLADYAAFQ